MSAYVKDCESTATLYVHSYNMYGNLKKYNQNFGIPTRGPEPSQEYQSIAQYTMPAGYKSITDGEYSNGYYTAKQAYNANPCAEYSVRKCPSNVVVQNSPSIGGFPTPSPSASRKEGYDQPKTDPSEMTIITMPGCGFCSKTIKFLQEHKIPFTEYKIDTPEGKSHLNDLISKHPDKIDAKNIGFPMTHNKKGETVVGFNPAELLKLAKKDLSSKPPELGKKDMSSKGPVSH